MFSEHAGGDVMPQDFRWILGLAVAALMLCPLTPGQAQATALCTHLPRFGWVSAEEVGARLERAGFTLLRLRITNEACYAALVRNTRGEVLELRIHPATSQIMPSDLVETGAIRR
jgi:hypothetical protein